MYASHNRDVTLGATILFLVVQVFDTQERTYLLRRCEATTINVMTEGAEGN